jgi:two-component system cell cycle response regulator
VKVLVADDEPVARRLLRHHLERCGYEVLVASDGPSAWSALTADDGPRLAVLDWNMPELDGVDVCRRLRARPPGPYTYVVLVTSRQSADDLVAGLESGADDFLAKPVDADELRARVKVGERLLAMEAELRHSRAYLASVLANIDSGVVLMDSDDRIVFANDALSSMAGEQNDSPLGASRSSFITRLSPHFKDPTQALATLQGDRQRSSATRAELEMVRPIRRVLRWMGQPVPLPAGNGWLDIYRDVTSEVDLSRALADAANTDHMTRLLNRRGGEQAIAREVSRATRDRTPLAFALLDVDHFKKVNDVHGHAVGDRVLSEIAAVVAATVRAYDLAVRWGGEEILLALPGAEPADARAVVERVRVQVENHQVVNLPSVTLSAGVDQLQPGEPDCGPAVSRADQRLYQAKAAGRNRVL